MFGITVEEWIALTNGGLILITALAMVNDWHKDNVIVKIVSTLAPTSRRKARHSKESPQEHREERREDG